MRACRPDARHRRRLQQLVQDAAVLRVVDTGALLAQRFQLLLQLAQLPDAGGDMTDMHILRQPRLRRPTRQPEPALPPRTVGRPEWH